MSDITQKFQEEMAKEQEIAQKQAKLREQKLVLEERRVTNELTRMNENDRDLAIAKETHFGALSEEAIEKLQQDNLEYIAGAKNCMRFINGAFDRVVPFFRKNLILIGGKTGEGKSTTVANIIMSTIMQKNPATGKLGRALVITNEEKSEDVYNRVTCLARGYHYTNHDKFTETMTSDLTRGIKLLSTGGRLMVVDNNYNGTNGMTTSIEGIQYIFENMIRDKTFYDVVIIDYYQNIKHSKTDPNLDEWKVQSKLANLLDRFKNEYPAPIVVLAQVEPPTEDNKKPFELRIKGRKVICDPSTLIVEMVADRANLRTEWIIHKSRFTESLGKSLLTGYRKGRFVEYTSEFIQEVNSIKEKRMEFAATQGLGSKDDEEEIKG